MSIKQAKTLRSFRLVCSVNWIEYVESLLLAEGFRFEPEPFSIFCRKLLFEPLPLGASLAAFFGYIYIQDRSSMLPPLALAPASGASVLDLAASPGSKSGFLCQLVGDDGFVLANEPNPARLATLRANLQTCNFLNAATCGYPGEQIPLAPESWKFILLDPPCSGWGTVEKHPQALKIWQGDKINKLIGLQRQLLTRAARLLAPGGRLLYSTCTTNPGENQEQSKFAISELGLEPLDLAPFPGFVFETAPYGALLINGEESGSQGFYLSLLRKKSSLSVNLTSHNLTATNNSGAADSANTANNSDPAGNANTPAQSEYFSQFNLLNRADLTSGVCDPNLLPPGQIGVFNAKARFLPAKAQTHIPRAFAWQGPLLGKWTGVKFLPATRLRSLLPPLSETSPRIILDSVAEVRNLLSGALLQTDLAAPAAALWWRNLPLGICQIKGRRVLAGFK